MRRGTSGVVSIVVVLALTFSGVSVGAVVAESALIAHRIALFSIADGVNGVDVFFRPFGLDRDGRDTVILKLAGDSVAAVQGDLGVRLSPAQKEAIKAELRARQDALRPQIEALGGTVLAQYQVAYNGMRVEIPRSALPALAAISEVTDISAVGLYEPEHLASIPLIGAPAAWDGAGGFRGEGIKIGIIDTGIDYTHANFGGPGTPAAYAAAHAAETAPANPAFFGPSAPKVKGGTDLVGDAYTGANTPKPDPNPLDCNGHGSHVSGTAAGFGVLSSASGGTFTYGGPYNPSIFSTVSFEIGPGVAPRADLYAIRVFGCDGFTRVVVDAIEWAVDHDMDVINMSLGSVFGLGDSASAEASNNAAKAGVIVVASAGNSGRAPYITGAPAVADRALSVAASEALSGFPGSVLALAKTGTASASITVQNSNGRSLAAGTVKDIFVLKTATGTVSLGCNEADWIANKANFANKLVVTLRGVCARVDRAIFGERHGAAAVAMINNAAGLPPFEGNIFDGTTLVTIPFFGVSGSAPIPTTLASKDGGTATVSSLVTITNPSFKRFAGFTSGGPRSGDSMLKPDITAPGVSTQSTALGTGTKGTRLSGTSMSAPHVTGVAALVRQAHPDWKVAEIKSAIVNTGNPAEIPSTGANAYRTSRGGTGLVQAEPATKTQVVAFGDKSLVSLSFGFRELSKDFEKERELHIRNHGTTAATFTLSSVGTPGTSPHTVVFSETTVTVGPGESEEVEVTLIVPAATVGNSFPTGANPAAFREVVGLITLTPGTGSNGGVALRVPYYLVPRALSDVKAELSEDFGPDNPSGVVTLTNKHGPITGAGDFYAWGLKDKNENLGEHDLRAVGVQSFLASATDPNPLIVFAVNTFQRWSNPSVNEFDILIDVNGDEKDDFVVVGVDFGLVTAGAFNGRLGTFVFDLATGDVVLPFPPLFAFFLADAPTDSSTLLLPVLASQLGLSAASPRFAYHAESFSLRGFPSDAMPGVAEFNAFTPAISNGQFVVVAPGATKTTAVTINPVEWAKTPALGLMIVVFDNASGKAEARLLEVEDEAEDD